MASMVFPQGQHVSGDELYMFGSNKNLSLGVGDEDDRQYPDRITLHRPKGLLHKFNETHVEEQGFELPQSRPDLDDIPTLVRNRPLGIRDVVMAKLHTAVITDDPVSNLYVCGHGRGGRLGLGNENTQFKFVPVEGPFVDRKVREVALGQNHTMAVTKNGELWTWGLNTDSQLGYTLPPVMRSDEEPMSLAPRQVFGPLKKEVILGAAASSIHSVAHTGTSLYCWGRNVGQLALMDADSRSLEVQQIPRKVAASLLSAPIEMVSAIDKATTCLLSNFTVWVFTNYGYNLVKFPFPDVFSNSSLTATSFSNRYDPGRRDIQYISSGGETIAAVTSRGDLFTMQLNSKAESNQPAGSTTNPVKIKSAVTQPQCVWDSRKDGVASVSVGEHGSVIICTESGAVWKRIKRLKSRFDSPSSRKDAKKKDFKFERVPYITNCVTVRSSIYGAFSAIRKDSKVMSSDISITKPTLWDDVSSMFCLKDFKAPDVEPDAPKSRKIWDSAIARERPGSVVHELLRSANIEHDIQRWSQTHTFQYEDMNMEVRTSDLPDVKIPVHSWLLSGRSVKLRQALADFQLSGTSDASSDAFIISPNGSRVLVTFLDIDLLTLLNVLVYCYQDTILPVWKYTREAPAQAYRFRQVRTELMKVATRLQMPKLEAAARLQSAPEPFLNTDMQEALADPVFFHDADMSLHLDGDEVPAHSHLICQRCPFFEGMFYGRSQGQWLADRRGTGFEDERIEVDLKHISPETFHYVMLHLYGDVGDDLFDDLSMPNIDEFSEVVLDVMGVANELMLDRLSQICQATIGKFVTTRNIANLLNEISPCSVTEFKDVGLEYICLQLESMLENHLLDGLDEDVLSELDDVVRNNQLARFPFVRSGRAELLLHEANPELALDIEEERRRRVKEMAFKIAQREEDKKLAASYRTRIGSLDESMAATSTPDKYRKHRAAERNAPFSPSLRPKNSHADLIFNMDDEENGRISSPASPDIVPTPSPDARHDLDVESMPPLPETWQSVTRKTPRSFARSIDRDQASPYQLPGSSFKEPPQNASRNPDSPSMRAGNAPWASPLLPASKNDLHGIMLEASAKSALTAGLASQASKAAASAASSRPQGRMSQKERKRQQMSQAEAEAAAHQEGTTAVPWEKPKPGRSPAPWKAASPSPGPKPSLLEAMRVGGAKQDDASRLAASPKQKPLVAAESNPKLSRRRTASPDTRFPGQGRANSSPAGDAPPKAPVVPHSKSYIKPTPKIEEPLLGASMADIMGQQTLEQQQVKEAVAKRSLQEIQEEQAFQEWWDQESRRAQEEEERRLGRSKDKEQGPGSRRDRKSRGGKATSGEASVDRAGRQQKPAGGSGGSKPSRGRASRGRGGRT